MGLIENTEKQLRCGAALHMHIVTGVTIDHNELARIQTASNC